MTRVKPGMRQRARRPKTSTGCKTCRKRHVKCDEAWPVCMKCIASKRTCLGYEDSRSESSAPSRSPENVTPPLQPALAYTTSSPEEQRALKYFQEQTIAQLCCYNSSELWDRTILQAAQTDDCIRHAVFALSSFHEIFTLPPRERQVASSFALRHYNAAIRDQIQASARKIPDSEDADRYMTASLLFVCIELLQDHYVSAFSLLANAIKLVSVSKQPGWKSSAWPRKTIEIMYNRLQLQAFGLLGSAVAADMDIPCATTVAFQPMPTTFASIAEARFCIEDMICRFTFAQKREEKDVLVRCAELVEVSRMLMGQWSAAFEDLLDRLGDQLSLQDQQSVNVLRIWQLRAIGTLEAAVASAGFAEPTEVWDTLRDVGEKIIGLAEKVVENAESSESHRARTFTLDHGIVEPIMCTALMCRDPVLRKRAIDVLRRYTSREGLYDSVIATCVIERAAQIEEAAAPNAKLPSDVPAWARIDSVLPTFQFGDRHAVFQITRRQRGVEEGRQEVFEEVISW